MNEKLTSLKIFEKEKEALEIDISAYEEEIKIVKKRKQEIFSTKEREKIIRNHESKLEIASKLEEAKNSLEKMKKKEIEINAKLSILQNYQLSTELEHFSDKINSLLKENSRLQELIATKQREITIQKSSEMEFLEKENSKKRLIMNLNNKNEELMKNIRTLEENVESQNEG